MKTRFNDPELFDSFMQIIQKNYKEAYISLESDPKTATAYKRLLTRAFHSLKKNLEPYANFNSACFQASSILDYNFNSNINKKKLDDNQIPEEVELAIKSFEKKLESEIGKSEIIKVPEKKEEDELAAEIMKYKEICKLADEKMEKLDQILAESRKSLNSKKFEPSNKDERFYIDIISASFY